MKFVNENYHKKFIWNFKSSYLLEKFMENIQKQTVQYSYIS